MELNATILIQAAIVLALMAWLSPVLFSPLMKVFDERDRRIHGAANEAKQYLGAADEKGAIVEQKTREAQAAARQVLVSLRLAAQEEEAKILAAAREEATGKVDEARAELFAAAEQARLNLKGDANAIADQIVTKVLGRAA